MGQDMYWNPPDGGEIGRLKCELAATTARLVEAERERDELRAAPAADKERVRRVLADAFDRTPSINYETSDEWMGAVSDKISDALASPRPADRLSIAETVRNAVLHFRSTEYTLAEKVATVCARQLAVPAAPHPEPTRDRPRPGTFLASPYSDDMCSWCGQARWNHNKSAASNLEGVVCPRRVETPMTSELVRQVVRASLSEATHLDIRDHAPRLDAIAGRAAEQLSGAAMPNYQELEQLKYLRGECVVDDYPDAAQFLDRLLGAAK